MVNFESIYQRAPSFTREEIQHGPYYRRTPSMSEIPVNPPRNFRTIWTRNEEITEGHFTYHYNSDKQCLNPCNNAGPRFRATLLEKVTSDAKRDNKLIFQEDFYPVLHKLLKEKRNWGPEFCFRGLSTFMPGLMEWTERSLGKYERLLHEADIYGLVAISRYPYWFSVNVWRAFCELWSPLTNTLHHGNGEMSISLNDLKKIAGLPILGEPYDEYLPTNEQLLDEKKVSPIVTELLRIHADLCRYHNTEEVSWYKWVHHFYRDVILYEAFGEEKPSKPRKNRHVTAPKPKEDVHEPLSLEVSVKGELAAILALVLSRFVLPDGAKVVRPETFLMASKMAAGIKIALAPVVLGHIYHGLGQIASFEGNPGNANPNFGIHFVVGWLAEYFPSVHRARPDQDFPQPYPFLARYAGVIGAEKTIAEARLIFRHPGYIRERAILFGEEVGGHSYTDTEGASDRCFESFLSIRSSVLVVRIAKKMILQPYYPNRFARQFGFDQDIPTNGLKFSFSQRDKGSLEDLAMASIRFHSRNSGGYFHLPPDYHRGACSYDYCSWWVRATAPYLAHSIGKVNVIMTNKQLHFREANYEIVNMRSISDGLRGAIEASKRQSSSSAQNQLKDRSKDMDKSGSSSHYVGSSDKQSPLKNKNTPTKRPYRPKSPHDIGCKKVRYECVEKSNCLNNGGDDQPFEDIPVTETPGHVDDSNPMIDLTGEKSVVNEGFPQVCPSLDQEHPTISKGYELLEPTPLRVIPVPLSDLLAQPLPDFARMSIQNGIKEVVGYISTFPSPAMLERRSDIDSILAMLRAMLGAIRIDTTGIDWFAEQVASLLNAAEYISKVEKECSIEKIEQLKKQYDDCTLHIELTEMEIPLVQEELEVLKRKEVEIVEEELRLQLRKKELVNARKTYEGQKNKLEKSLEEQRGIVGRILHDLKQVQQAREKQQEPLEIKKIEVEQLIDIISSFLEI